MANLTAKFKLIDEMSDKMEAIATSGQSVLESWEQIGTTANSSSKTAATAADGVATSLNDVGVAAGEAATQTDYWTSAVGNYDKSALEAIYTTEELVEMGLKSADALNEQSEMFALCEQSAAQLTQSMEAATDIHDSLSQAQERAAEMAEEIANADGVSAEAKEELTRATENAITAMEELEKAQADAEAAMEEYDRVMESGTTDLAELEAAAERAGHAAEELSAANQRATEATEDLTKASDQAGEELEKSGKKGADAMNELEGVLAAAGITALLKEMAEAAYDLAEAFSEAEKTVVLATGATGEALEGLEDSMMNVYATAKSADLSSTAGAVGEINTRLGLTGEKLEEVTGLFLDYSNVTGQNVVPAVANVTKVMNQWGVGLDGIEGLMDKLTVAGQASGISVSSLSDTLVTNRAVLQQLGFTLDESIGLFAELELQGINSQTAMMGFRTAINKFSDDGLDASDALRDVIQQIAEMGDESAATALAVDTFGSRAGVALAGSIRSGQLSIEGLTSVLDGCDGAMEKTATASQTMGEKWQQASNSMKSAFTDALQPTINDASNALAGIMEGVGKFLKEHPIIVKALTALALGVSIFTAGVVGYTVATKAAAIAQAALNAIMDANPIFLLVTAIVAATAALAAFAISMASVHDETEGMTATTRAQYYELQDLNAQYDEACEKYGETSEEASRLKYQIDDLSASYEAGKQTLEEYLAEVDDLVKSVDEVSSTFDENMREIRANELGTLALIQKFADLSEQTELTAAQEKELEAVSKALSDAYPELKKGVDDVTLSTEDYVTALKNACAEEARKREQEQAEETYIEALQKQAQLTDEIAKAEANLNAEREAHDMKWDEEMGTYYNGWYTEDSPWASWTTDLDTYLEKYNELIAKQEENDALIAEIEQGWQDVADAEAGANDEATQLGASVDQISNDMCDAINDLTAAYNEAYDAAKESFDGQFALFDEAEANMDSTVANAQAALDSQLAYWDNYLQNVNVLKETSASDLGITQENYNALMQYVQDGSAEAAGLAQSMVAAIQQGDSDAVAALANTLGEVNAKKDQAAQAVAEWQTDFDAKMQEIVSNAEQAVKDLNMSDEATAAAISTMNAYASNILTKGQAAVANARSIASQVAAALSSTGTTVKLPTGKGYAEGTDYATPGPHLVGENGPEIVEFRGGEKVYNNDETERIMARTAAVKFFAQSDGGQPVQETGKTETGDNKKTIRLEINGGGTIDVNGSMDEETVVGILQSHLKPVLTSIVKQEIYEEGEQSYDF